MATKIVTKNSSTASAVPTASDLVQGELAVNVADKRLFTENNAGAIVELGTNPYNFTANHNGSAKLATTATGIDVTGTATMDGLSLDNAQYINFKNSSNISTRALGINGANTFYVGGIDADIGDILFVDGGATRVSFANGGDVSFYEDTGTTAKFFWDASAESLGIGETSPLGKLHIKGTDVGATASAQGNSLVLEDSENGLSILSSTAGAGYINFGDSDDNNVGMIIYGHSSNSMNFWTNAAERMRIDSAGNLLVGTTDTTPYDNSANSTADNGIVSGAGLFAAARYQGSVGLFNRTGNDGEILGFKRSGANVGSIGTDTSNSDLYIGNGNTAIMFHDGANAIFPHNTSTNAGRDAGIDIGYSSYRFKDLYLSGGVYLGGTGAANHLDDYEEGTWTPVVTDGTNNATMYTSAGNGGTYTKIGRVVTFTAQVTVETIGSVGANAYISGLPFTNGSAGANRATAAIGYGSSLSITAGRALTAYVELNQQNIYLKQWDATTGTSGVAGSEITNGGTVFMSGAYFTA